MGGVTGSIPVAPTIGMSEYNDSPTIKVLRIFIAHCSNYVTLYVIEMFNEDDRVMP